MTTLTVCKTQFHSTKTRTSCWSCLVKSVIDLTRKSQNKRIMTGDSWRTAYLKESIDYSNYSSVKMNQSKPIWISWDIQFIVFNSASMSIVYFEPKPIEISECGEHKEILQKPKKSLVDANNDEHTDDNEREENRHSILHEVVWFLWIFTRMKHAISDVY